MLQEDNLMESMIRTVVIVLSVVSGFFLIAIAILAAATATDAVGISTIIAWAVPIVGLVFTISIALGGVLFGNKMSKKAREAEQRREEAAAQQRTDPAWKPPGQGLGWIGEWKPPGQGLRWIGSSGTINPLVREFEKQYIGSPGYIDLASLWAIRQTQEASAGGGRQEESIDTQTLRLAAEKLGLNLSEWAGVGADSIIEDYDELSVQEVTERLDDLSFEELEKVKEYERRHQNREILVEMMNQKLNAAS